MKAEKIAAGVLDSLLTLLERAFDIESDRQLRHNEQDRRKFEQEDKKEALNFKYNDDMYVARLEADIAEQKARTAAAESAIERSRADAALSKARREKIEKNPAAVAPDSLLDDD